MSNNETDDCQATNAESRAMGRGASKKSPEGLKGPPVALWGRKGLQEGRPVPAEGKKHEFRPCFSTEP